MFVNLCPHKITITDGPEIPSGGVARISTADVRIGEIDGIPLHRIEYGVVTGLPDPEEGTWYVVSTMVRDMCPGREDLVSPDSGPTAKRKDGQIISVRGFMR